MGWLQVNSGNNGFVQASPQRPKYVPSRFVGPKRGGGYQGKERAHWANPDGSWAAAPQGQRGTGQGMNPNWHPMPDRSVGPGPPINRQAPIQDLLLQQSGQQSQIQRLLAIFAALGHLPQEATQNYMPRGPGNAS